MDTEQQIEAKKLLNHRFVPCCGNCGAWTGESCQTTDGDERFPTNEYMVCDDWEEE